MKFLIIVFVLFLACPAFAESPLDGYEVESSGNCEMSDGKGNDYLQPCLKFVNPLDSDCDYFAVFSKDKRTLLFIFKSDEEGVNTIVWRNDVKESKM